LELTIESPEAKSISLNFKNLSIPDFAEIYLFTGNKDYVHGPITNKNFPQLEDIIASEILPGSKVTIYYTEPKTQSTNHNIHIISIGYGYRGYDFYQEEKLQITPRSSGSCNVNITDNRGDCFRMEQHSVALLLEDLNTALCTGTLVNNTAQDLRPFILSANHCFDGQNINLNNVVARFRYWQGNSQSGWISFTGVTLRANSNLADFTLLELNQNTNPTQGIFYQGWSRATQLTTTTVVHHPSGDVMKISRDVDNTVAEPQAIDFGTFILPANSSWRVNFGDNVGGGDYGFTEPGSSGAGLLNPNHRIIGTNSGGGGTCVNTNRNKWYGRFDASWFGNNTNATRLSSWLDPNATNAQDLISTFWINTSLSVPCANLNQDAWVRLFATNGGAAYTYTWTSSPNITITGAGNAVTYRATSSRPVGSTEWIQCEISTPAACGGQLIARSVQTNLTWVDVTQAYIKGTNSSNGQTMGTVTAIPLNNCRTFNIGFEGIPVPNGVGFSWSFTGNTNNFYTSTSNNGRTITVCCYGSGSITANAQVTNGSGCITGISKNFAFTQGSWLSDPNQNDTYLTNAQKEPTEIIKVFPNPAGQNHVIIQLPETINLKTTTIKLTDLYGRVLQIRKPENIYEQIDVTNFVNGIYLIEVNGGNSYRSTRLIINK